MGQAILTIIFLMDALFLIALIVKIIRCPRGNRFWLVNHYTSVLCAECNGSRCAACGHRGVTWQFVPRDKWTFKPGK